MHSCVIVICCTITNLHTYIQLEIYKWKLYGETCLVTAKETICDARHWFLEQKCGQKSSIYPQKLTRCLTSSRPPPEKKNKLELPMETSLYIGRLPCRLNIFEDPICFLLLVYTVTRTWSKIKVFKLNTVLNAFAIWYIALHADLDE